MKINGFVGKGTGKIGASVWSINGGEQIVRQYNPKVTNPKTDAQNGQRSKFKLMSQLAADLSQTIAFKKEGLVSARNRFVSANIGNVVAEGQDVKVVISDLDLTGGSIAFPLISKGEQNAVQLAEAAPAGVVQVVYACYKMDDTDQLSLVEQKVVTEAGQGRLFPTTFASVPNAGYIFAYGIVGEKATISAKYENYIVNINDDNAILEYVKSVTMSGAILTKSSGLSLK